MSNPTGVTTLGTHAPSGQVAVPPPAGRAGGLCRVTVIAPKTRVDLALPADVPLADLLPVLLRYAGEDLADEGTLGGGWVLARLGGATLDSTRTPDQLEIRDGEQLYFTPRNSTAPDMVFDDVVDAVATANRERGGRWKPANTRRFGLAAASGALLLGVLLAALTGPPQLPGGLAALGVAAALLVAGAVLSRALSDSTAGAVLAVLALCYAVTGGTIVLGGHRPLSGLAAPHLLAGGAVLVLFAVLAALAVADHLHLFVGATICGLALVIGAGSAVAFGLGAAGGGAVAGCLALATTPALPSLAFRLGRLPIPSLPTSTDDVRGDRTQVDGAAVLARSQAADRYLTGLLGAIAVIGFGTEVALAAGGTGWPRLALLAVLALVLLTRARGFNGHAQRVPLMVSGLLGLGLAAVVLFAATPTLVRLGAVLPALLLIAVVALVYGLAMAGRRVSPVLSRTLDIVEVLLIVAVVPLAMWVAGLFAWIRAIKG